MYGYDSNRITEALHANEYDWAYTYLLPFAEAGVTEAECMLGVLYQMGLGCKLDPSLAENWFLRAAHKNDAVAWNNLGTLYCSGALGYTDEAKATACYQRAFNLGGPSNAAYL